MLRIFTFCLLLICQLFTSSAVLSAYFSPEPTALDAADGNYTIKWKRTGLDVGRYRLYETLPSGSRTKVYSGSGLSQYFSGKVNGSYKYEIYSLTEDFSNRYEPDIRWKRTDTYTVKVDKIVIPPKMSTPAAPSTDNDRKVYVSWAASTGKSISKYQLYVNKSGSSSWAQAYIGSGRAVTYTAPSDGTYNFKVRAYNSAGWGGFSNIDKTITSARPSVPSSLLVPNVDYDGSVYVSWGASTGSVDKYQLYQQTNSGSWVSVYYSTGRSRTATLSDGKYKYKVRACNIEATYTNCSAFKESYYSYVVRKPGVPSSLSGIPSSTTNKSITVRWGGAAGTVKHYELQQSYNGGSYYNIYTSTGRSKKVSLGIGTYKFRVRTCNEVPGKIVCSGYRTSGAMTVILPSPFSFSAIGSASPVGTINMIWRGVAEATNYTLQESKNSGSWATISSSLTHRAWSALGEPVEYSGSYNRVGRAAGTYKYRIKACKGSSCSLWRTSGAVSVVFPPTKPNSITVPTSTVISGTVVISWSASSNTTYYQLQEKKGNGSWGILTNNTSSRSYSRTGRTDASYTYRVTACNTVGCDTNWRTSTVVGVVLPPIMPPTFSASASTTTRGNVSLSWGGLHTVLDASSYTVQQSKDNGSWTTVSSTLRHTFSGGNNGEPIEYYGYHTITGLAEGSYKYRLKACKSTVACTDWRNSSSVTIILNNTPTISGSPEISITTGQNYNFMPLATDADDDTLTFSVAGKPSWATFDATTGLLSGTPQTSDIGFDTNIVISVSDGTKGATLASFDIEVLANASTLSVSFVSPLTGSQLPVGEVIITASSSDNSQTKDILFSADGSEWFSDIDGVSPWKYNFSTLSGGDYTIHAKAVDLSSQESPISTIDVELVLAVPEITIDYTAAIASYVVEWTVISGATTYELEESINQGDWLSIGDLSVTSKVFSEQPYGDYSYRVQACDVIGNCSLMSVEKNVNVDVVIGQCPVK